MNQRQSRFPESFGNPFGKKFPFPGIPRGFGIPGTPENQVETT
jgi:hypothetical protein